MALEFAHGAIQWNAADAIGVIYTVSGLPFQPKAIRFYWTGIGSAVDAASQVLNSRRGIGFAVSPTNRMCVATRDVDGTINANCSTGMITTGCVLTVAIADVIESILDLDAILTDGFRLIVDEDLIVEQGAKSLTVFWEAWGGSDIQKAYVQAFGEGTTSVGGGENVVPNVAMFAGVCVQTPDAGSSVLDSGLSVGFASADAPGDIPASQNAVVCGSSDDAAATMLTDGYCKTGECIALIAEGGGNPASRALVTNFGNPLTLSWLADSGLGREFIALFIAGGRWRAGSYTINGNSAGATATVSGLPFAPVGISLIGRMSVEQAAGVSDANDRMAMGSGNSTVSRRSVGHLSEDGTTAAQIDLVTEYDQVLAFPSAAGALLAAYDINQMNAAGFQIVVDVAGGVASEWQGYLAFGSEPRSHFPFSLQPRRYPRQQRRRI